MDHITREHELTWYDARGCGLSDREAGEVSLEAWERDLEAVVEAKTGANIEGAITIKKTEESENKEEVKIDGKKDYKED